MKHKIFLNRRRDGSIAGRLVREITGTQSQILYACYADEHSAGGDKVEIVRSNLAYEATRTHGLSAEQWLAAWNAREEL